MSIYAAYIASIICLVGVVILAMACRARGETIEELKMDLRAKRAEVSHQKDIHDACANAFLIDTSKARALPISDVEDRIFQLRIQRDRHHDECLEWRTLWYDKVLPALGISLAVDTLRDAVITQIRTLVAYCKESRAREKELLRLPKSIAVENAKLSEEVDSLRYQIHELIRSHRFSSEIIFALEKMGFAQEFGWDGIPKDVGRLQEHAQIMEARVLELERQLAGAVSRNKYTGRYVKKGQEE